MKSLPSHAEMVRLQAMIFENAVGDILTRLVIDARETTLDEWAGDSATLVEDAAADIRSALKALVAVVVHAM